MGLSGATRSLSTPVLEKMPGAGIISKLCPMEEGRNGSNARKLTRTAQRIPEPQWKEETNG